jgi:hypothetical protein
MANLMTATNYVKEEILTELRKGNTEVLKGLPPVMAMSYGMAMQNGGTKYPSPIEEKDVNEAMLNRLQDSGVKEMLIKKIKQEEKERIKKI